MQKIILLLLFIIFLAPGASAQRSSEIGLSGGGSYYIGELNPGTPFVQTQPAYGIFYRRNLNSRLALQLHGFRGTLKGDGGSSIILPDTSLSFKTKVTEIAAQFEVNFFDYFIGSQRDKISPYIFGGVGVFMLKTKYLPSFPFGLGLKYSPGQYIGLGMEWGMRKTINDKIDGISDTKPGTEQQRGNSQDNDWYSFAMLSISFKFRMFEKEKCLDQDNYRSPRSKSAKN